MLQNSILLASVIDSICSVYQLQYNKQKKTIYGISFDYTLFSVLSQFLSILSSFLYIHTNEYSIRYPIYPNLPISLPLVVFQVLQCFFLILVLLQLRIYINTRNTNQGISPYSLIFLGSLALFLSWILKLYIYRQGKIISLDVIDWIWYSGRIISCVKFMPIISMNWFDQCVIGMFPYWSQFQILVLLLQLLGKYSYFFKWWQIPVNYPTWLEVQFQMLCILIIRVQIYIYKNNKPSLEVQ